MNTVRIYAPKPMNQLNMVDNETDVIDVAITAQSSYIADNVTDYQIFIIDAYIYHLADITTDSGKSKCDFCGARSDKIVVFGCIDCIYNKYGFEPDCINMINNYVDRPVDIVIRPKSEILTYNELDATIFFNCGLTIEQFNSLRFVAKGVIINKYNDNAASIDNLCSAMFNTDISSNIAAINAPVLAPEYVTFIYITDIGCIISITVIFKNNRADPYLLLEPRVYGCSRCSVPQSLMCYPCILATSAGGQNEEIGNSAMSADITSLRLSPATINILNTCLLKYNCEFVSNNILELAKYILENSDKCLHCVNINRDLCRAEILRDVIGFDQSEVNCIHPELEKLYDTYDIVYSTLFK